jgi:hypothetical protein
MKKLFVSIIFLCLTVAVMAQPQLNRRIYLWDVTLSMWGLRCVSGNIAPALVSKDIYQEVVNFLIQDIESIDDENTEIYVLPFQENILVNQNEWHVTANYAGKREIIQKIRNYPRQGCSWTNIVRPIEQVQANIISPDKNNILILLTDGMQSNTFGGENVLINHIRNWGQYAERNFAHCLYVMLTEEGKGKDLGDVITEEPRMDLISDFIVLQPEKSVVYNFVDEKGCLVDIKLIRINSNGDIPDNLKVRIVAEENDYIIGNQTCDVKNNKITFTFTFRQKKEKLREDLPVKTFIPLRLEVVNKDELQKEAKLVFIDPNNTELELINKPEKRLIIRYE